MGTFGLLPGFAHQVSAGIAAHATPLAGSQTFAQSKAGAASQPGSLVRVTPPQQETKQDQSRDPLTSSRILVATGSAADSVQGDIKTGTATAGLQALQAATAFGTFGIVPHYAYHDKRRKMDPVVAANLSGLAHSPGMGSAGSKGITRASKLHHLLNAGDLGKAFDESASIKQELADMSPAEAASCI